MKILIVSGMFPPIRTGTAFYTSNLAKELESQGHDIEIITLEAAKNHRETKFKINYLRSIQLPLAGFFKHFRLSSFYPMNWVRMYHIIGDYKPDTILLVNHYLDIAFPTLIVARICKIPIACSVGTQLQSLNPIRGCILSILDWFICGQLVFRFCDLVIAWDKQILKYLEDVHGYGVTSKTKIVNYGVNGDADALVSHKKSYDKANLIVGIGAVSEQRSFVNLVKAFSLLTSKHPNLKLRIVGHVYYSEAVELTKNLGLSDKVEFVGEQSHDTVLETLRSADVYCASLSGKYTGMGTATIEAMLLGLPCVVNTPLDILGNSELKNGVHLFQSENFHPEHVADCIDRLISDDNLRQKIGTNAREFVKTNMNWSKVATEMVIALSALLTHQVRR